MYIYIYAYIYVCINIYIYIHISVFLFSLLRGPSGMILVSDSLTFNHCGVTQCTGLQLCSAAVTALNIHSGFLYPVDPLMVGPVWALKDIKPFRRYDCRTLSDYL